MIPSLALANWLVDMFVKIQTFFFIQHRVSNRVREKSSLKIKNQVLLN